jgi:hypothetical protein
MDIIGGGDIIEEHLSFFKTEAINDSFDFFGIGDTIMVNQSGSFFFILGGIWAFMAVKALINWCATKAP